MLFNNVSIEWVNHHAGFKLKYDNKVIYIDPWEVDEFEEADLILVTHAHYDHFSLEDIKKLSKKGTIIIGPSDVAAKIGPHAKTIMPGKTLKILDVTITAVAAYNTHHFRSPQVPYHPKENNWVGYIVQLGDVSIYHAGDTDKIDEMKNIKADVVLLHIGGTYTMDAAEAAQAANLINPQLAIPMHWGNIVGDKEDADAFAEQYQGETRILESTKK